jgi:hypothetical protein
MLEHSLQRNFYSDPIATFLHKDEASILGELATNNAFALDVTQRDAWVRQIVILKAALRAIEVPGRVYFEYSIPRLGRRADVVLLLGSVCDGFEGRFVPFQDFANRSFPRVNCIL